MNLADLFSDEVGKPFPFFPKIARQVGGVKACIFLCRFAWWHGRQADPDGWIYKSQEEILEETGLVVEEQLCARKKLKSLKILEERNDRLGHRMFYRLNFDVMREINLFGNGESPIPESEKVRFPNPTKSDSSNPTKSDSTNIHITPDKTVQPPLATAPPLEEEKGSHKGKNAPDPRIREFSNKWCEAYHEVLDEKYVYNGSKDTEAVKRALSTKIPIPDLITLAARAWRKPKLFYCKQSLTIAGFVAKINEIRNELKTGGDPATRVTLNDRLRALDELIESNPANTKSGAYRPSFTPQQKAQLEKDRETRRSILAEIARAPQ